MFSPSQNNSIKPVIEYLCSMASFNELKGDDGQNLLQKRMENIRRVNQGSALYQYLSSSNAKGSQGNSNFLIFPFGCNSSQLKAVKNAMNNQISIIQGPPGTGKTQTILNIIANLLVNNKTVLVVSNNNEATKNVLEKLSSPKYGLGFLGCMLGSRENFNKFFATQQKDYPNHLEAWKDFPDNNSQELREMSKGLDNYFNVQKQVAKLKAELDGIEREFEYFSQTFKEGFYPFNKNVYSIDILDFIKKFELYYAEKERVSFFQRFVLKFQYGFGIKLFSKVNPEIVLGTLKHLYYTTRISEIKQELAANEKILPMENPSVFYEDSLRFLQKKIYERFKEKSRKIFKDWSDVSMHPVDFVNEYPIIFSTTFSSRSTLNSYTGYLYDYVIMDESSQVDVVTGALALSCARNAVIVGDDKQLPNVIPEHLRAKVQNAYKSYQISPGYSYTHSFLKSVQLILPKTPQTLLQEHYRCHPKIIQFCNKQFYGGQLIAMTEDKGEDNVLSVVRTVPGDFARNHYNQRQIDVIDKEILPAFTQEEIEDCGIIAPYNNQVDEIKRQIPAIDVATVHKFQGREKDSIIISTVDNEISEFTDDPRMLNVAISRAKKKLSIVVSGSALPPNSNIDALVKYIQYMNFEVRESKLNSIFDFLYTKYSEEKLTVKDDSVSIYETENRMNTLLKKILSSWKYNRFGFVFELPLKHFFKEEFLSGLPQDLKEFAHRSWAHVDFTIYSKVTKEILFGIEVDGYNYHKKGTKQRERDQKKDEIFKLAGMTLLRFNTRGSDEETSIRNQLDKYL